MPEDTYCEPPALSDNESEGPSERLFFRRLAVEKGENAAGGSASALEMSMPMRRCRSTSARAASWKNRFPKKSGNRRTMHYAVSVCVQSPIPKSRSRGV